MKNNVLIGIALLILLPLLAGCSGTKTTATTTAATTAKTTVVSNTAVNTAAATTTPTTAKTTAATTTVATTSATTTATTTSATTTATTTSTTTTASTSTAPTLSFAAAIYTDTTYKFSFQYDASWTTTWKGANTPVAWANALYDPSVRIYVFPKTTGDTLADVLTSSAYKTNLGTDIKGDIKIGETKANVTNVYGTTATPILFTYTHENGSVAISEAFGTIQGDKWFIMHITIADAWSMPLSTLYPDEIFSTWQFTK